VTERLISCYRVVNNFEPAFISLKNNKQGDLIVFDYLTVGIRQRNTWLEVLIVETVDTFFIPKVATIIQCVIFNWASTIVNGVLDLN